MEKKFSIQEDLTKLEEIVNKIEDSSLNLDDSLALYQEGSNLIKKIQKSLKEAEDKVEHIIKDKNS